jgi:hypothetical protein
MIMERLGKMSESNRGSTLSSGNLKARPRSSPPRGKWWWQPTAGKRRVSPNSHFKDLLTQSMRR